MEPKTSTRGPSASARFAISFVFGIVLGAVIVLGRAHGDLDKTAFGDGLLVRSIAARIGAAPQDVNSVVASRGTSLRYGRIGMPAAAWLLAGGKPHEVRLTHPIVVILATGFTAAAAAALFPFAGPLAAMLPFLAPGFPLSVAGGYGEVTAVAAALWGLYFALRERWWPAAALLSYAILSKETAGIVLIGVCIWCLLQRRFRGLVIMATSLVPVLAWWGYVAVRYGHIPILDPYLTVTTDTTDLGIPGRALLHSLLHPISTEALVMTLITIALAIVLLALMRRSAFGIIGAPSIIQLFGAAPFAWKFIGDAARLFTFLQLFVVFAIVASARRRWVIPEALAPPARQVST